MDDYQQSNVVKVLIWIIIIVGVWFIYFMFTATEYEKDQLLYGLKRAFFLG